MYVKDSLEYEQIGELEDDLTQSVWIRASFMGSKKAYFCHMYREFTSTLGNSLRAQRSSLESLTLSYMGILWNQMRLTYVEI